MVEQEFKIGDEVEYNSDYDSLVHEGFIAFHTTPGNVCVDFGPKCRFVGWFRGCTSHSICHLDQWH